MEEEVYNLSEPGFEKIIVASWHIRTLPHWIPSTFE